MSYYKLGILTTRICNQKCYYCNNYYDYTIKPEIDIDYVLYILNIFNKCGVDNLYIELSGGEPGLLSNLKELIDKILGLKYIKKLDILTNGYIRKYNTSLITDYNNIKYIEHPCLNINDKILNYFYDDITFYNNIYNNVNQLIVMDDLTVTSLINNFNYFKNLKLFNNNIFFKLLTPKKQKLDDDLLVKYKKFFSMIKRTSGLNYHYLCMDELFLYRKHFGEETKRLICSKISSMQYIDLQNKIIGQCSMNVDLCYKADITEENIKKTINGLLFTEEAECCKQCIKYNDKSITKYITKIEKND
jgi:hypothetical protein